jgi:hypothetical protein
MAEAISARIIVFAIDSALLEQQPEGISIKNDSLYKYYAGFVPCQVVNSVLQNSFGNGVKDLSEVFRTVLEVCLPTFAWDYSLG